MRTTNTGVQERLKAYSGYNLLDTNAYIPAGQSDSGYFYYSGNHCSVFNYQATSYALLAYPYEGISVSNYNSPYGGIAPFSYQEVEVMSDSEEIWNGHCSDSGLYSFGLFGKSSFNYSGNDMAGLVQGVFYPTPGWKQREQFTYDTAGRLQEFATMYYDTAATAWVPDNIDLYFYDTYGHLVMDSTSNSFPDSTTWYPEQKDIYTVDAAGNVIFSESFQNFAVASTILDTFDENFFTYNADNTLRSDSALGYGGGAWYKYSSDSFGYTSGISYYTYHQSLVYYIDTVTQSFIDSKHVSAAGMPDTVYYQYNYVTGGAMKMQYGKKCPFAYDTLDNPVWASEYNYHITDSVTGAGYYDTALERIYYYYYEIYGAAAPTHIANPVTEIINIYPNPTNGQITIYRPDAVTGSHAFIRAVNEAGQTLRTESLQWMNASENFSLNGLPTGIYILTIEDNNGNILNEQKVIKQ